MRTYKKYVKECHKKGGQHYHIKKNRGMAFRDIDPGAQQALRDIRRADKKQMPGWVIERVTGKMPHELTLKELDSHKFDKDKEFRLWTEQAKHREATTPGQEPLSEKDWADIDKYAKQTMRLKSDTIKKSQAYRKEFEKGMKKLGDKPFDKDEHGVIYGVSTGPIHRVSQKAAIKTKLLSQEELKEAYPYLRK